MTRRDMIGWVVTLGVFIGLVSAYWCVPYVATWWIMTSSFAIGAISGIEIESETKAIKE